LNAGHASKLILLSAPAGSGKTTLLSQWIASSQHPFTWVSLDGADNDQSIFWGHFVAALQTIHSDLGKAALAALQSRQPPSIEVILSNLINEIAQVQSPLTLVLDDFHVITAQPITHALLFFLENMPSHMHLVISSRSDPPWPLSRMRVRREISELRADDLRFTTAEATSFLNDVMGLGLTEQNISWLDSHTEGWIAGLQMAALSMQGRDDIAAFISSFSGSHRFILDYLVEEVLNRQPDDIKEFLLQTSVLERMTASLCNSVTGREGGQDILRRLEQENLFIIPLDDERRWYRYHHLFSSLLQNHLQQGQPNLSQSLHRRASQWYSQNGLTAEAVSHAFAAGDMEEVARLVEQDALQMIYHGQLATLIGWLDRLPPEVVRTMPWLSVAKAWALAYSGELHAAAPLLHDAEEALANLPAETPGSESVERDRIAGHIATIRSYVALFEGGAAPAAELARQALDYLPEHDMTTRGFAALILGVGQGLSGDYVKGVETLKEAAKISQAADDTVLTIMVLCDLAAYQTARGQLGESAATSRNALQLADEYARQSGQRPPAVGFAHSRLSRVLAEWNDLEEAQRHAREAIRLSELWGQKDSLFIGYACLAYILEEIGDLDGAQEAIQETIRLSQSYPSTQADPKAWEARLRLKRGEVKAASRWVEDSGLSVHDEVTLENRLVYATFAQVLIAEERLNEALTLLARMLQVFETGGALLQAIDTLTLMALVLQSQGNDEQALETLEHALSLAEPEGFVRTFIGKGNAMERLLQQAAAQGVYPSYVNSLLQAFAVDAGDQPFAESPPHDLIDPLSDRELQVLRLLNTSLTSTEIAQELFISPNTVRSHIKNIYGKLDVHRRSEAVKRAKDLDLL
jgi:LuxR family maltose regulon positive regulatory protein